MRKQKIIIRKDLFKKSIAAYVAQTVKNEFYTNGNDQSRSFNSILYGCLNYYRLNKKDVKQVYDEVDKILLYDYELLIANSGRDKSLYLVDLKEERRKI